MKTQRTTVWHRFTGLLLLLLLLPLSQAYAWTPEDYWVHESYADQEGEVYLCFGCEECGASYGESQEFDPFTEYASDIWSDIEHNLMENFCDDCGYCSEYGNDECYTRHHCADCGACVDDDESHDIGLGFRTCDSCWDKLADEYPEYFCYYCREAFRHGAQECGCTDMVPWHCTDCSDLQCENCGGCIIAGGEETYLAENACMEHAICGICLEGDLGEDGIHCPECHNCDQEICTECGLCEGCYQDQEHCPECDFCFGYGNEIQWCLQDGEHCIHCCEDNDWICDECGDCAEATGKTICDDCGLCEECCLANSEDAGCSHGYCIESSDFLDHACPECQQCPDDNECPDCGLCEDCQSDYHCEHELCPESSEWDEHLCSDCGDCFDPDELCEYCGKCESCADGYHCEHDYCPDDGSFEDDGDHFICYQCGDCFEGSERCDNCELCTICCAANTESQGCEHELCVESDEFADHWCYEDEQCLEKCNHNADCAHNNIDSEWAGDNKAHWKVCDDCGAAVMKAIHTEGDPVTVTEPNSALHTNGKANVYCAVCDQFTGSVSIPYVPIPEDGSPYIIDQPKNYEGKVSDAVKEGIYRYTTFKVRAGGKDLKYQWYRKRGTKVLKLQDGGDRFASITGKDDVSGATTSALTVVVECDACYEEYLYYCVVSNDNGYVTTNPAKMAAQHAFDMYVRDNWFDDSYGATPDKHYLVCVGDGCTEVKKASKHRYSDWTLIQAATDTQTGLLEQKCMDCMAKNSMVIPRVEPGHVHTFDQPRYDANQHWFACRCGVLNTDARVAHLMDKTEVTIQPTEKRNGRKEISCSTCGYTKSEAIDKLPHTHVWYTLSDPKMWIQETGKQAEPNPQYWGRYSNCHYFRCKSCDAVKNEEHAWEFWSVRGTPTDDNAGAMSRRCETCNYREYKTFPQGTYPIMMMGATADKDYAKPGEKVTITYDAVAAQYGFADNPYPYPVKLNRWVDLTGWDGSSDIPYGKGWITVPRVTFANATALTTTFTMPNGPATVVAVVDKCTHSRTGWGDAMAPTCTLYGHERDKVCMDCGTVITTGQPIEPLGHVLSDTPIEGTAIDRYCTVSYNNGTRHSNPETHGYSGDFLCTRCNQAVKGKNVPLKHGWKYSWNYSSDNTGSEVKSSYRWENQVNETCTKDGYFPDLYCNYCGKVATKGHKVERTGHDWGEWETIREATTTVKGMEKRICAYDESHHETRTTDYSGPDYRLKADKTKLVFRLVNDKTLVSQSINFTSVGRDKVLEIVDAELDGPGFQLSVDGMKLTCKLDPKYLDDVLEVPAKQRVGRLTVVADADGEEVETFTAPEFAYAVQIVKASHNLVLPKTVYIGRPGRKFISPQLKKVVDDKQSLLAVANVKVRWTSSDNSVATVNPETGEVTPLAAGDVRIYANFEGDRFYQSEKVYYQMKVIGEQQFAGSIWQIYKDPKTGKQVQSEATALTLKINPSTKTAGMADVNFGAFTLAQTKDKLGSITLSNVDVQDQADGKVFYNTPLAQKLGIPVMGGLVMATATVQGLQGTPTGSPIMVLNLTVSNRDNIIVFGPEGTTLKQILAVIKDMETGIDEAEDEPTKNADIYDLLGRKLERITQPGIYIEGGKKMKK